MEGVGVGRLLGLGWLFVCLFRGAPVVRGGLRLKKDGPCATRRQAEAFLFVCQKPWAMMRAWQASRATPASRKIRLNGQATTQSAP